MTPNARRLANRRAKREREQVAAEIPQPHVPPAEWPLWRCVWCADGWRARIPRAIGHCSICGRLDLVG